MPKILDLNPFAKKKAEEAPGTVPELSTEELEKQFKDATWQERRALLERTVTPRDKYGRRRIFSVAHHTKMNRAERRAAAKARGVRMAPGFNKPFVRGDV